MPIADDVPRDTVLYLREHGEDFPGVTAGPVTERAYPEGSTAAHLIGYVGAINDTELKVRKDKGYQLGDEIGKTGVESIYEDVLRGQPGVTQLEVNAAGRPLRVLAHTDPVKGSTLQLTLDLDVQKVAEDTLAKALEADRQRVDKTGNGQHFVAPAGAVSVIDPTDGSVIALASYPTYNPADFVGGISTARFTDYQNPANHFPLNNRAIGGLYQPGSTFKLFSAVAALESGILAPNTVYRDTGSYTVPPPCSGKCVFRNSGGQSHGSVNLAAALTVSSDAYFYSVGASFWQNRSKYGQAPIQDVARDFGLGAKSGVQAAGELGGQVSDPALRQRLHANNPAAFPNSGWFVGDSISMAIGQSETVTTPLQLANAYAALGNGGTLWQPRVAANILDSDGQLTSTIAPVKIRTLVLPDSVRLPVLQGLRGVPNTGTAQSAFAGFPLSSFPVAGKTGTAQVGNLGKPSYRQDTALFVAFAPADAPRFAVSVVLEEAGFGGDVAAPVARRIFDQVAGHPLGAIALTTGVVD